MSAVTAYFMAFCFGAVLGGFLYSVVERLYVLLPIFGKRQCFQCQHWLAVRDQLPIISHWLAAGICRWCGKPLPKIALATEFVSALVLLILLERSGLLIDGASLLEIIRFISALITAAVIILSILSDIRYRLIYDIVVYPGSFLVLMLASLEGEFLSRLGGIFLGAALYALPYKLLGGRLIGLGDVKLAGFLGAALGATGLIFASVIAYGSGALAAFWLLARRRANLRSVLPFGVFLAGGGLTVLIFSVSLIEQTIARVFR